MRFLAPVVLSSLLSTVALADPAPADPAVAVIDDEPAPQEAAPTPAATLPAHPAARHAPAETGQLRAARIAAPAPVAVKDNAGVAREHAVAPAQAVAPSAVDADDVVAELAAHQMKRHQRALDGCLAAAHKRAPAVTGTLALELEIADRKVKSVRVSDDSVHDSELARCLTTTARAFTFSLAAARFRWPLALQP